MLTEREVMAVERFRDQLRALKTQMDSVNSKLAMLTNEEFDWDEYNFDPEHLSDAIADYLSEVSDSISLMSEAIEEFDKDDE
jgi:hypothetical protein